MRKIKKLLSVFVLFIGIGVLNAQTDNKECIVKYNLFKGKVSTKKYTEAKDDLLVLMKDCPKLSLSIYSYGFKIARALKDPELMKTVFDGQMANFQDKGVAKAHDVYASFLIKNKLGTEEQIQGHLAEAFKSPKDMGIKNVYRYFKSIYNKNKDENPQVVFDSYDNVLEAVSEKLEVYGKKLVPLLKKEQDSTLTAKDKKRLNIYKRNSKATGQIRVSFDQIIETLATCDRLIPLLNKQYDAKQSDAVWLRRSVSRLYKKKCQSDPLYEKLARQYAKVSPSAKAYNFLAVVLEKNGDEAGAKEMRLKAFDLETDPLKKARLKYMEANDASRAGKKAKARSLAREALKYNPNLGQAYLLIASLYQRSANSCGKDEFEKRMVYVAALNKALKANAVDPSCGAGRYISSYRKNIPKKTTIFEKGIKGGSSYRVGCWIGETVSVPRY